MIQKETNMNLSDKKGENNQKNNPPGYPLYPIKEDIYNQGEEKVKISQEDLTEDNILIENPYTRNENAFEDDKSENDLDIPGSELDDQLEDSGSEDEENNYYSIGGDEHNELEEDKG